MEELWKKVLNEVEIEISKHLFVTFFKSTTLGSIENSVATVNTASFWHTEYIEKRYYSLLKSILDKLTGKNISIVFVSGKKTSGHSLETGPLFVSSQARTRPIDPPARIRPDFTFETLAVSESSNQLGYTAAIAVATHLGTRYNPLFFYGTVGVGKTHLMHSIANKVFQNNTSAKILYLTTEEFTNEIVESIQNKTTTQMRQKFRNADLLLLDDIQFLSGKEKVQEELFHTFNTLIDRGKQIIFASDRPPHELKKIEARLISRFEGGLTIDIQPPDFETRTAILLIKSKKYGLSIDYETAKLAAENILDTRALEGFLLKASTLTSDQNTTQLTPEVIRQTLGNQPKRTRTIIHSEDIIQFICDSFDIKPKQLKGTKRDAYLVKPRHICMYLLKDIAKLSYVEIGNILGGRDHTTVMHGVEKVENLLKEKDILSEEIMGIKQKIRESFLS